MLLSATFTNHLGHAFFCALFLLLLHTFFQIYLCNCRSCSQNSRPAGLLVLVLCYSLRAFEDAKQEIRSYYENTMSSRIAAYANSRDVRIKKANDIGNVLLDLGLLNTANYYLVAPARRTSKG